MYIFLEKELSSCFIFLCSYSNIFVTSPSPDNLHTLFEFIFKGFDALQYQVRTTDHFTILHTIPVQESFCISSVMLCFFYIYFYIY